MKTTTTFHRAYFLKKQIPNPYQKKAAGPSKIIQLENLISGLSTTLVDTPEENLEKELNNWIRIFVEFLEVDRSLVNEYLDNKTVSPPLERLI